MQASDAPPAWPRMSAGRDHRAGPGRFMPNPHHRRCFAKRLAHSSLAISERCGNDGAAPGDARDQSSSEVRRRAWESPESSC